MFMSSYTVNFNYLYLPHMSVAIIELRQINPVLGNFVYAMRWCWCFDSLCFDMCISSAGSTGPEVSLSREEEVDLALLKNDSGVESALLYAKASSKYIKDLLAWMEKRLAMGETLRLLTVHWDEDIEHHIRHYETRCDCCLLLTCNVV